MSLLRDKILREFFMLWATAAAVAVLMFSSGCAEVGVKSDTWQAVFLTTGQVYYGKLSDSNGEFYRLDKVYYLRRQPPAEGEEEQQPEVTLVKMGTELHTPEDFLEINRDHIIYIEDLNPAGQLAQGIMQAEIAAADAAAQGNVPPPAPGQGAPTAQAAPAAATLPTNQLTPEEMEQFRKFQEFQQKQESAQPQQ